MVRRQTLRPAGIRRVAAGMLLGAGAAGAGRPALAQPPRGGDSIAPVRAMGLPETLRPYAGAGFGIVEQGAGNGLVGRAMIGLHRDLIKPVLGIASLSGEGWASLGGGETDGGMRVLLDLPASAFHVGVEYSFRVRRLQATLMASHTLRRGGFPVPGALARVEWVPARGGLAAGFFLPISRRPVGRTRPAETEVVPVQGPHAVLDPGLALDAPGREALAGARRSALWIARSLLPHFPPGAPERALAAESLLRIHLTEPGTRTPADDIARYHTFVTQAFAAAIGTAEGGPSAEAREITDAARRILLGELLLPFDRDLGRIRSPAVLEALSQRASLLFAAWTEGNRLVPPGRRAAVLGVYDGLLRTAREVADTLGREWGDSRYLWLPLQLALLPEEHDSQAEVDRLIEQLTGQSFASGHDIVYATDERFEPALRRSILEAREYHLLWIHDVAGADRAGSPDSVSGQVVLRAYFPALRHAAEAFDSTGTVPAFLIFLDEYYYSDSRSGRWLSLLQDPLGHRFHASGPERPMELAVRAAQDSLKAAIAASPALQRLAAARGRGWLERLFSVRVSVTHPPDLSFRAPAGAAAGALPVDMPDDFMRDHRKIVLADVTAGNPGRGVAMLSGIGVGESYARYRWLDRTIILRGPAAVTIRTAARELLRSQGFRDEEIPRGLREEPRTLDLAHQISALEARGWTARALIAMNEVGYGAKHATAAKAALYTLMPAGSVIVATDPQWLSRYWGAMLLGSALRGCKVLVVGPGPDNAPFEGNFVQMVLQRELFLRFLQGRDLLREPIAASGGMLQVGLFRIGLGTHNVPGGVRGIRDGLRRYPFLRNVLTFDRSVWDLFESADSLIAAHGLAERPDTDATYHPKFHLKTQFFATAPAMREAVGRPEWREFFARRINERLGESPAGTDIIMQALTPLRPYLATRGPEATSRDALYLLIGSQNQDNRSFMLDGEAVCLVAGENALLSAGDMLLLTTVGVEWLESAEELSRQFPPAAGWRTALARAFEALF